MTLLTSILSNFIGKDKKMAVSFVRWLLLEGCIPVDYTDESGESFVSLVVETGDMELVCEVVEKRDASLRAINAVSKRGFSALDYAFLLPEDCKDKKRIIDILLANDARASYGLLNQYIVAGNLQGVKEISQYTSSFHVRDSKGNTPLMLAAEHNRKEIVEYLVGELKLYSFGESIKTKEARKAELREAKDIASVLCHSEIGHYLSEQL